MYVGLFGPALGQKQPPTFYLALVLTLGTPAWALKEEHGMMTHQQCMATLGQCGLPPDQPWGSGVLIDRCCREEALHRISAQHVAVHKRY